MTIGICVLSNLCQVCVVVINLSPVFFGFIYFSFTPGVVLYQSVGTGPAWNGDESKISNPRRVISTHKQRIEWMSTELLEEWKMWRTQDERCSTWQVSMEYGVPTCLTWHAQCQWYSTSPQCGVFGLRVKTVETGWGLDE
jgi:hypothetical protein